MGNSVTDKRELDDKGNVRPKRSQPIAGPQKEVGPVTAAETRGKLDAVTLKRMQQTVGNAAVQRFLAQRRGGDTDEIDEETAATIDAGRGGGRALDEDIAAKAGAVMGRDFSGVNVHSDDQANRLSRRLGAQAFTTGNDIFFGQGQYDPATSSGQRLIAHELTHVAQQGASPPTVQGKMTVNDPDDQYEAEAEAVAETVMNQSDDVVTQRQEMRLPEEEDKEEIMKQPVEEEEELAYL